MFPKHKSTRRTLLDYTPSCCKLCLYLKCNDLQLHTDVPNQSDSLNWTQTNISQKICFFCVLFFVVLAADNFISSVCFSPSVFICKLSLAIVISQGRVHILSSLSTAAYINNKKTKVSFRVSNISVFVINKSDTIVPPVELNANLSLVDIQWMCCMFWVALCGTALHHRKVKILLRTVWIVKCNLQMLFPRCF